MNDENLEEQVESSPVVDADDGASTSEEEMQLEADIDAIRKWEQERSELLDTARRLQADFENYRKRMMREQAEQMQRATEALIEQLLPVLDSFELAVGSFSDDDDSKVRKGVELVYAEFLAVLEKNGLERIDALGAPFNPNEHEAVLQDEGDGDGEPVVSEVLRTGWKLKGRVVRPAMVKVSR